MSPFDFNDNGEIDGEDFFLLNGSLGGKDQNDNNKNKNPVGCGSVIVFFCSSRGFAPKISFSQL
ncbi:hypothetical protein KAI46_12755 [bacterium]|nr:hypothetical protein [bacterium]